MLSQAAAKNGLYSSSLSLFIKKFTGYFKQKVRNNAPLGKETLEHAQRNVHTYVILSFKSTMEY